MKDIDYIHDSNPIVGKLLKLKYLLNDVWNKEGTDSMDDRSFVIGLIHNIRKRDRNPSKIQLEECNKIWSEYAD